jgi:hypothetical protein
VGAAVKAGQPGFLETTVRDDAGVGTDPATLTLTVRDLTGTAVLSKTKAQLVAVGGGVFRYFPSTGTGGELAATSTYMYEWRSTTPNGFETDWLDVVATLPGIINLADAKAQIDKTKTKNDAEIRFYVDAVNSRIETEYGPIMPRVVTETATATRAGELRLSSGRIAGGTVPTVLNGSGASVSMTGWTISPYGRLIPPTNRIGLYGTYTVTYVAGFSPVPPDVVLAARELFADWWKLQRLEVPAQLASLGDADAYMAASATTRGYAIPNSVAQKLAPYEKLGGFA